MSPKQPEFTPTQHQDFIQSLKLPNIADSFYFIRHGQTDWNKDHRLQGHTDIPLNATGKSQARTAIEAFSKIRKDISVIISSNLGRAHETAMILSQGLEIEISNTTPDLRERHYGDAEGKTAQDIAYNSRNITRTLAHHGPGTFRHADNAEPFSAFMIRIFKAVSASVATCPQCMIAAHGGVFTAVSYGLTGDYYRSDNCVPYFFERHDDNHWTITNLVNPAQTVTPAWS